VAIYILIGLLLIWLMGVTYKLYQIISHYNRLIKTTERRTLKEILDKVLLEVQLEKDKRNELEYRIKEVSDEILHHIQKVGILRFNPFEDTGGDQSFVLTILDGKDSGIVLTSLHNRGNTRWYAKNVHEGKGVDHILSSEEQKAIHTASKLFLEVRKDKKFKK
jgi:hypothetical protein